MHMDSKSKEWTPCFPFVRTFHIMQMKKTLKNGVSLTNFFTLFLHSGSLTCYLILPRDGNEKKELNSEVEMEKLVNFETIIQRLFFVRFFLGRCVKLWAFFSWCMTSSDSLTSRKVEQRVWGSGAKTVINVTWETLQREVHVSIRFISCMIG